MQVYAHSERDIMDPPPGASTALVRVLNRFLELLSGYTTLEITTPTIEDQVEFGKLLIRHRLGYTDLLTLRTMNRNSVKDIYSSDTVFDTVLNIRRIFDELS